MTSYLMRQINPLWLGTEKVLFFLDVRHGGGFALDFKFHFVAGEGKSVGAFLVVVVGGTRVLCDDVP